MIKNYIKKNILKISIKKSFKIITIVMNKQLMRVKKYQIMVIKNLIIFIFYIINY